MLGRLLSMSKSEEILKKWLRIVSFSVVSADRSAGVSAASHLDKRKRKKHFRPSSKEKMK